MIISHKYKFIFIKTLKTAGTSLEIYLSKLCGPDDIITPIVPHVEPHRPRNHKGLWNPIPEWISFKEKGFRQDIISLYNREKYYNHISATTAKSRTPKSTWDSYYKFCVERNPWDKTLSHYFMLKDRNGGEMNIEQYFNNGVYCKNYPKYTDKNGDLLVDQVIKYENLNGELSILFKKLGVPYDGELTVKAKSTHRSDRTPSIDFFSPTQIQLIADIYADEIKMHNYTIKHN